MIAAFAVVALRTFWNRLTWSLRRLRKPRYAIGAVAGALYFWFAVFRNARVHVMGMRLIGGLADLQLNILSLVVLVMMIGAWALPADAGGLSFTEAEIAFLFPAPLSRRDLLLYRLIRSQPSTMISAFFMTIFALRGNFAGLWISFTILGLYFTMVSLGRARLRLAGVNVVWRVVGVIVIFAALTIVVSLSFPPLGPIMQSLGKPQPAVSIPSLPGWMTALLFVPRLFVSTVYPKSVMGFASSAVAILAIGALCLLGAIRLNVSFEEASLERSRRRSDRRERLLGQQAGTRVAFQHIRAPFQLAETGAAEVAIVWKNVIALMRISLGLIVILAVLLAGLLIAGLAWPQSEARLTFALLLSILAGIFPLIGPNFFRNDLRLDLARIEVLKSYPIAGDRLVAAEIAAPLAVISLFELGFLGAASALINLSNAPGKLQLVGSAQFLVVALLVTIPVCALQLVIRNAVPVLFPAWAGRSKEDPRGFIMLGQRLVVLAGNLVVLFGALLPAAVVFVPSLWIAFHFFSGSPALLAVGTLPAIAVIVAEIYYGTTLLGAQFDQIDVSADLDAIMA